MKVCERCTENNNCAWQNHEETICHDAPAFPMTNGGSIRSMTDEELAEFMFRTFGRPVWCLDNNCPPEESCVPCWLEWLKQERENLNEQTN